MAGYTRVDTINNIADGNVINAADLDGEFDGIQAAFNSSTGHNHDGTAGEGAPILALGPVQDVTISTSVLGVKTTNTVDLGTTGLRFKDFYLAGNASIGGTLGVTGATTLSAALTYGGVTLSNAVTGTGNMVLSASPTLTGTITAAAANFSGAVALNGNTTIGDADTDTITQTASYVTGTQLKSAKTATNTLSLAAYDTDGAAYTNLITLTASTTPTLALTSTGVGTINNMSIGATTASTGAFTTLSATGVTTVQAGTALLPAITTTGDTNTGIWFPAADTIAFTEGGVESMRITSAGDVGIGTTSPSTIGVSGFTRLVLGAGGSATEGLTIVPSGTGGIQFTDGANTEKGYIKWISSTGAMNFGTAATTRLTVDSSGNVGIAQTDPTTNGVSGFNNLVIGNSASTAAGITLRVSNSTTPTTGIVWARNTGGANGFVKYDQTNEAMQFGVAGVEKMRIDSDGDVGIGTASPAGRLHVFGNVGDMLRLDRDNTGAVGNQIAFRHSNAGTLTETAAINAVSTANADTGSLLFYTKTTGGSNTLRMTIDSAGNVGIGVTPSFPLDVQSTGVGSTIASRIYRSDGTIALLRIGNSTSGSGSTAPAFGSDTTAAVFYTNNSEKMRIDSSGNVGIGTTSPTFYTGYTTIEVKGKSSTGGGIFKSTSADGTASLEVYAVGGTGAFLNTVTNSPLLFSINGTTQARLDTSGNFGLGVTPSAWGSSFKALQINYSAIWGNPANTTIRFSTNTYNNGTNFIYLTSNYATYYAQDTGTHAWFNAPSGTAATTATFTQAMTLDASGRLGIGVTSPTRTLDIAAATGTAIAFLSSTTGTNAVYYAAGNTGGNFHIGRENSAGTTFGSSAYASVLWSEGAYPLVFATNNNERARIDAAGNLQMSDGAVMKYAPAPASLNAAATLTNANIQTQIISTTGTTFTLTMPLGTTLETLATWGNTDISYDFYVVNTASGTVTMAVNTGVTSLGTLTIATGVSAQFRIRRTAANTFVLYRLG